jgi:hypothetical protein
MGGEKNGGVGWLWRLLFVASLAAFLHCDLGFEFVGTK